MEACVVSDSVGMLVGGRPAGEGYGPVEYRAYPILLVMDDAATAKAFQDDFGADFWLTPVTTPAEAVMALAAREYALVVATQELGGLSGIDFLGGTVLESPHLIRILIVNQLDEVVQAAISGGQLYQYIPGGWDAGGVRLMLQRAIESYAVERSNRALVGELQDRNDELERLVGERTAQIREWAERQRKLAISDGLTGLYNHRHFQERWRREVKRTQRYGQSVSLMIIDVDTFKNFNDTMGHPQGDQLLRNLSLLLARSVRDVDLVARYGGEEFVIMLPETRKDDAVILAERVRSLVAQHPFEHRDVQPGGRITVSVGVASFPADGGSPSEVLVRADKALYRAKEGGRDRVMVANSDGAPSEESDDEGDLALIVEEDGDTRIAAPSATDVPVAGAIDTMRLRMREKERFTALDDDPGVIVRPADDRDDEIPESDGALFLDSMDEIVVEVDDFFDPSRSDDDLAPWTRGRDSD